MILPFISRRHPKVREDNTAFCTLVNLLNGNRFHLIFFSEILDTRLAITAADVTQHPLIEIEGSRGLEARPIPTSQISVVEILALLSCEAANGNDLVLVAEK